MGSGQDTAGAAGFISQPWDWDGFLQAAWGAVTVMTPSVTPRGSHLCLGDPEGQSHQMGSVPGLKHLQEVWDMCPFGLPGARAVLKLPSCQSCAAQAPGCSVMGSQLRNSSLEPAEDFGACTCGCESFPGGRGLIGMCAVPVPVWNPSVLEHCIQELPEPCRAGRRHWKAPNPKPKK